MYRTLAMALAAWLMGAGSAAADADTDYKNALAQRFRPFMKFSYGVIVGREATAGNEDYRPCSWQFLFNSCDLTVDGKTRLTAADIAADPASVLRYSDITDASIKYGNNTRLVLAAKTRDQAKYGEPWPAAVAGNGLYAHVEQIAPQLYNIEYYMIFAYNYAVGIHEGDLEGIQLVYDQKHDQLLRASFSMHGHGAIAMDLTRTTRDLASLTGRNFDSTKVDRTFLRVTALPHAYYDDSVTDVPHQMYFAQGATAAWDHPVVFLEKGDHEAWPGPAGKFGGTPTHNGEGYSYLPEKVQLLDPTRDQVFYNFGGEMGDGLAGNKGPVGLRRHRMWYYPKGRPDYLSYSDYDPYKAKLFGTVTWPTPMPARPIPEWIDFDSPSHRCNAGTVACGLACRDSYCGAVALACCPATIVGTPTPTVLPKFSEEQPAGQSCADGSVVVSLQCSGKHCDDLTASCIPVGTKQAGCAILSVSEEDPGLVCPPDTAIHQLKCRGSYCDRIDFTCCKPSR